MADPHYCIQAKHQGDLLWRPILLEIPANQRPLLRAELRPFSRTAPPSVRVLMGDVGLVRPKMPISMNFPANGRSMPVEHSPDPGRTNTLPQVMVNEISFSLGDLLMAHRGSLNFSRLTELQSIFRSPFLLPSHLLRLEYESKASNLRLQPTRLPRRQPRG